MKTTLLFVCGVLIGFIADRFEVSGSPLTIETIYEDYHPTMDKEVMQIRWERDPEKVQKALTKYEKKNYYWEGSLIALALWKGNKCTIYALEPDNQYDSEAIDTLGHEMLHCFKGEYHDE